MIAAVVPAAGQSLRMGRPKLVLEVGGQAVIARVVSALRGGGAEVVVVVVAPPSEPGAGRLEAAAREAGAEVVVLEVGTPDMRATVEHGLAHLERLWTTNLLSPPWERTAAQRPGEGAARPPTAQPSTIEPLTLPVTPPPQPPLRGTFSHEGRRRVPPTPETAGTDAPVRAGSHELLGVLIAPGDSVGLTPALVAEVVARFLSEPGRPVVPVRGGRRGHPLALPWADASRIASLPTGTGVNRLLDEIADRLVLLEVTTPGHDVDLDTPEDLERLAQSPIPSDFSPAALPARADAD